MHKLKAWYKRNAARLPSGKLRRWWKKVPKSVRAPLVAIVGSTVIITGIAMLVLPGPGWAAIFLGIAILASEFAFAEKVRDWLVGQFKTALDHAKGALKKGKKEP